MKKLLLTALLIFPFAVFADTASNEKIINAEPPLFNTLLPRSVHGNFLAGRTASIAKDVSAASTFWRAAYRQEPSNSVLLERAFISSLSDGMFEFAFPLAERIISLDRNHRLARLALMTKAAKTANFKQAKTHLQAMQKAPNDFVTHLISAWINTGTGEVSEALAALEKLGKDPLFQVFNNYHAGLLLDVSGQNEQAGVRLEKAYSLERSLSGAASLRVTDAYGRWLSKKGNKEDALKVFSTFDSSNATDSSLLQNTKNSLEKGFTLHSTINNPTEGLAEVFSHFAFLMASNNGDEVAALYGQFSRYLNPSNEANTLTLAENFQAAKNYYKSISLYKEIKQNSPLYVNTQIQMGYDLDSSNKSEEALKHFDSLAKNYSDNAEVLGAYGNLLRHKKRYEEAAGIYTKLISQIKDKEPKHWLVFYNRAIAYERAKKWDESEKDFREAMRLIPENHGVGKAQLYNYLGYSYVDIGIKLEEGLKLIQDALKLSPRDAQIIDSLGWAYFKLGRYEEAVTELEKALEIKNERRGDVVSYSDDPTLNDHLGDAYWYAGRRLEAQFQWNKAKDLSPEADELAKILNKIKNGLPEKRAEFKAP